jgi:hypothetical protein
MIEDYLSQNELVLKHLQEVGSLTSLEAIQKYGITRISARVYDLRERGHDVQTELIQVPNRRGKIVRAGLYYLDKGVE